MTNPAKKKDAQILYLNHQLMRRASDIMLDLFAVEPHSSYTKLAECAAIHLNHDEWLDNPEHWVWDMALSIGDPT